MNVPEYKDKIMAEKEDTPKAFKKIHGLSQ